MRAISLYSRLYIYVWYHSVIEGRVLLRNTFVFTLSRP